MKYPISQYNNMNIQYEYGIQYEYMNNMYRVPAVPIVILI